MAEFSNIGGYGNLMHCGDPSCPQCNKGRDDTRNQKSDDQPQLKTLADMASNEILKTISGLIEIQPRFVSSRFTLDGMNRPIGNVTSDTVGGPSSSSTPSSKGTKRPSEEELRLREKVKAYFLETKHQVCWDDVVGNEAARAALLEAIEHPVTHKDLYGFYGRQASKGVLLYGPPGCGKTMFGKAAAAAIARIYGSDDVPLLKINGPEIQSPFIGMTEGIIRDIFAYARAFAKRTGRPLVVFIDEADSLLPSRDGAGGRRATSWEESQVAAFLAEMDGLETSGAFVILATNRPHAIDAAVLRDGRCDRKIKVLRPDRTSAEAILLAALKKTIVFDAEVGELAARTTEAFFDEELKMATIRHSSGMDFLTLGAIVNGAMLNGLVERAKSNAFRRDLSSGSRTGVTFDDIKAAIAATFAENARLSHFAAVEDLAEIWDVTIRSVEPYRSAA